MTSPFIACMLEGSSHYIYELTRNLGEDKDRSHPFRPTVPSGQKLIRTPSLSGHCAYSLPHYILEIVRPDWILQTHC